MKKGKIRQTIIARIVLLTFCGQLVLSCSQFQNRKVDPAEEVLNNLSKRFNQNDLASSATNPHADFGKEMGKIYQSIFQKSTHEIYHGSLFVPINTEDQKQLKAMTRVEVERQGFLYAEEYIDGFTARMADYRLTSEDVTRYLSDAVKGQAITKGEHDIIFLELQEMAGSTSNSKVRAIIRTVDFEINNSNMSQLSKDKILKLNAFANNSIIDDLGPVANYPVPTLLSGPFQKTTPITVATVIVIWAVATLIDAFLDPSCTSACQITMAANAATYVGLAQLVCMQDGVNSPCPCLPPCFLNGSGYCTCP